jgi:ATP-binding cassette subfamily F protein uup
MAPPLLHLRDIVLTFGGRPLLDGAEVAVAPGDKLCLVGRNGSGKSTLLKVMAGLMEMDRGTRFLHPSATLRYLPQEPDLAGFQTAAAYVEAGLQPGDDPHRARLLLGELGLTGDEWPEAMSGGELRRSALARILGADPDILLLDEPTNHLDLPTIEWLEAWLARAKAAVVMISHDRRFLTNVSRGTLWIDRNTVRALDKGFEAFEGWRDTVIEQEERERHKLDRKIADEEHWLRYGVTARRKRNVRRLGDLKSLRTEARDWRERQGDVRLTVTGAADASAIVIAAKDVGKGYGERPIVSDFSIRIGRRDRIGIVGPNGAGKTTLLSLLTGAISPDRGHVAIAETVQIARLDQMRQGVDPRQPLKEAMTDGRGDLIMVGTQTIHVMRYLKDFLFTPDQANTPVGVLSGGERARLMLARALAKPSNLLVLDEPTNDLDLETLDLLQEMVADYPGAVILVSHDRDFLDRTVTATVAPERAGRWSVTAGGYADMIVQRKGDVAARPAAPRTDRAEPPPAAALPAGPVTGPERAAKLSFKDRHRLDQLPALMDAMRSDIGKLETVLADPDLYATNRARHDKAAATLAALQAKLSEAEDEWLRLEMLREELQG